ncbi:MAG: hypothetical protein HFJ19_04820 [Clostridia bacterium]|nr:hypothetical protein [Clostridia bacterium]
MKKSIVISVIMFLIITIFMGNVSAASATVSLRADNVNPEVGNTITITISFSQPVGTASLNLNYNKNILQYVGSNAWKANDRGGSIKLDYIDANFENKTITSMTVTFKTIAEGAANFTVSNIVISNANGDELQANISGNVTANIKKPSEPEIPVKPENPNPTPNPTPNPKPNPGTNNNTNKKPNTSNDSNTNKNTNTNTNTDINTTPITDTNISDENVIDNSINDNLSSEGNYNETDDESNVLQNEEIENGQDVDNGNKPIYIILAIILIIAVAIIIVGIVIYRIRNYE